MERGWFRGGNNGLVIWGCDRGLSASAGGSSPPAGWLFFEAGSRPGGRLPFLDSPRKVRSKKATRMSATLRFAAGNLRRGGCGVRRETHFALHATFRHHGESDDEASLSCGRLATPQPPRRRRGHTGWAP